MLRKAPKLNMADLESSETIGALHTLYSMTLTPIGEFDIYMYYVSIGEFDIYMYYVSLL